VHEESANESPLMEPKEPAMGTHPEPDESITHPRIKINFIIILPPTPVNFEVVSSGLPLKILYEF
jgi:hypothetical protein